MAWTAPRTWTQNEIITAALFNTQIQENLLASLVGQAQANQDLFAATAPNMPARIAVGTAERRLRTDDEGDAVQWWLKDDWEQIYQSPNDSNGWNAIVKMNTGAIVRARQTSGGAVLIQKITDPTVVSQWTTWTELKAAGTTATIPGIALASSTTEDRVCLFYTDANERDIRNNETTDAVTWVEELVSAEASPARVRSLAADMTGGDRHLVFMLDLESGAPDEVSVAIEKVAGAWGGRVRSATGRFPSYGLAVAHVAADNRLYCILAGTFGTNGADSYLVAFAYNTSTEAWVAGDTTIISTLATSAFYRRVRVRWGDGSYASLLYQYVEGAAAPFTPKVSTATQASPYVVVTTVSWAAYAVDYGMGLLYTADGWYLSAAKRAWRTSVEGGPLVTFGEEYEWPWYVPIDPIDLATGNTNWSTRASADGPYAAVLTSSGAQNDEIFWDVPLSSGAWTLALAHHKASDAGIITVLVDDVSQGTIDLYAAASDLAATSTLALATVATDGLKRLKLRMATKNASSSNYKGYIGHIALMKTGP